MGRAQRQITSSNHGCSRAKVYEHVGFREGKQLIFFVAVVLIMSSINEGMMNMKLPT